jgi:glycosyltransferase involved in cell wall biosynthesis
MPGYVSYQLLPKYYGAADVFIHLPPQEPWGLSVSEAMACGVPVISAPWVGAASELVEHGVTGWECDSDVSRVGAAICQSFYKRLDRAVVMRRVRERADVAAAAASLETLVHNLSVPKALARKQFSALLSHSAH